MIDWSCCPAVEHSAERCRGAWVFRSTRIPVAALFEHLESNASIGMFVEWFPGVTLAHVRSVLTYIARSALPEQPHIVPCETEGGAGRSGLHTQSSAIDIDPIVAEVHVIRAALSAAAGGDFARICATLRAIETSERAAVLEIIDGAERRVVPRVSAAPVFRGTRVPLRTLLDYLTAGDTLDAFLTNFPNVSREHAVAVLHLAMHNLDVLVALWPGSEVPEAVAGRCIPTGRGENPRNTAGSAVVFASPSGRPIRLGAIRTSLPRH
jgi:uncharacterized protein (DUF433 family)